MTKDKIILSEMDANFKNEIASMPGAEHFQRCFTCGTCTAACPVAEVHEDYDPRRIIRMCILGMKKEVLSSDLFVDVFKMLYLLCSLSAGELNFLMLSMSCVIWLSNKVMFLKSVI